MNRIREGGSGKGFGKPRTASAKTYGQAAVATIFFQQ